MIMEKIDFNDPKTVRNWEERIARFEGWEYRPISPDYPTVKRWHKDGNVMMHKATSPKYSRSLSDLFRVLLRIGFYTVVGDDKDGHDCYIGELRGIGARCFDTPEKAIFQAICQYLRQYHPTVGEEQEEIERGAQ